MCDRTVPRVCALGCLVVRDADGNEHIPTGRAERTLLLLLAVNGSALSIDQALAVLWPDANPRTARRRLHYMLRSLPAPGASLVTRKGQSVAHPLKPT